MCAERRVNACVEARVLGKVCLTKLRQRHDQFEIVSEDVVEFLRGKEVAGAGVGIRVL